MNPTSRRDVQSSNEHYTQVKQNSVDCNKAINDLCEATDLEIICSIGQDGMIRIHFDELNAISSRFLALRTGLPSPAVSEGLL